MTSDDLLYRWVWSVIGIAVVVFILTVGACYINKDIQINDALTRNLDPTTVACAFQNQHAPSCVIRALPQ